MPSDKLRAFYERQRSERESAMLKAAALIAARDHDAADALVQRMDPSIQGAVILARSYQAHLEDLAANKASTREHREAVFRRALSWAQRCYPEPHTAMEADDYRAGRAEDLARLVRILGYDPGQ